MRELQVQRLTSPQGSRKTRRRGETQTKQTNSREGQPCSVTRNASDKVPRHREEEREVQRAEHDRPPGGEYEESKTVTNAAVGVAESGCERGSQLARVISDRIWIARLLARLSAVMGARTVKRVCGKRVLGAVETCRAGQWTKMSQMVSTHFSYCATAN